jgi:hypothetical protein
MLNPKCSLGEGILCPKDRIANTARIKNRGIVRMNLKGK